MKDAIKQKYADNKIFLKITQNLLLPIITLKWLLKNIPHPQQFSKSSLKITY